jgi:hypothetical protein
MSFVYGFICGAILFAVLFNVIHKQMVNAFERAGEAIVKKINDAITGNL